MRILRNLMRHTSALLVILVSTSLIVNGMPEGREHVQVHITMLIIAWAIQVVYQAIEDLYGHGWIGGNGYEWNSKKVEESAPGEDV